MSRIRRHVFILFPTILAGFFLAPTAYGAAEHVVIREIQISGATAADEFIEIYNPTANVVNLRGWRLSKRTNVGRQTNLLTSFPAVGLGPGQHFLVAHPTGYTGRIKPDAVYSTHESMAENNAVVLFDSGRTVIDLVGFGTASFFASAAAPNPPPSQSLERRSNTGSIMDTDNNAADFMLSRAPTPTNAAGESWSPTPTPELTVASPPSTETVDSTARTPRSAAASVTGVVVATPGMVGEHILYLNEVQGTSLPGNLRVSLPDAHLPPLSLGQRVRLRGKLRSTQGLPYLAVSEASSVEVTDAADQPPPAAAFASLRPEDNLGLLVETAGTIEKKYSRGFTLALTPDEHVRVTLPRPDADVPTYPRGTKLAVRGILWKTKADLTILARQAGDFTVLASPLASEPPPADNGRPNRHWSLLVTLAGAALAGAGTFYYWHRRRRPKTFDDDAVV